MLVTVNNDLRTTRVVLHVPHSGPGSVDIDFPDATPLSGAVTVEFGEGAERVVIRGMVDDDFAGTFGEQRKARIVFGANGWSKRVKPLSYSNDAGVKFRKVADELAAEVGEKLASDTVFAADDPKLRGSRPHFARRAKSAASVMDHLAGLGKWWVDYDGITRCGDRPAPPLPQPGSAPSYQVIRHDPRENSVELSVESLRDVGVGTVLTVRLDEPQTIQAFELTIQPGSARMIAWCGVGAVASELADLLSGIVSHVTDRKLFGKYRYRVLRMHGDRCVLQVVRKALGVPDLRYVRMWPGVGGAHSVLASGTEVLVEFEGGDPEFPMITGFEPRGNPTHVPERLELCGEGGLSVALRGGLTRAGGVGTIVTFDLPPGGNPMPQPLMTLTPYLVSFGPIPPTLAMAAPLWGANVSGSPKVTAPP
jgi:hypothetical protein